MALAQWLESHGLLGKKTRANHEQFLELGMYVEPLQGQVCQVGSFALTLFQGITSLAELAATDLAV